jgi:hypothetical protein
MKNRGIKDFMLCTSSNEMCEKWDFSLVLLF